MVFKYLKEYFSKMNLNIMPKTYICDYKFLKNFDSIPSDCHIIELDDLDYMELILDLEEEFCINIEEKELLSINYIHDLVKLVEFKISA